MHQTFEVQGEGRGAVSVPRGSFSIAPRGLFSLAEAQRFLCGFAPLRGAVHAGDDRLRLAFGLDGTYAPAGVSLRQEAGGAVRADVVGTADLDAARRQACRVLSLDVDGAAYDALAERDPVIGALQRRRPGFRPVCFCSPYEAGVQAILGQRISIAQAAQIRRRLSEQHGARVAVDGRELAILPSPAALLRVGSAPGVPDVKLARLHALAEAALEGRLDAERLRAMPVDDALDDLARLPGIGAWSAAHILFRGAALADVLPLGEPRLLAAASVAYGKALGAAELTRIAEAWRPHRMWVSVLLVAEHGFSPEARAAGPARGRRGSRDARATARTT